MGDNLVVVSDAKDAETLVSLVHTVSSFIHCVKLGTRSSNYSSRKYYPYAAKYRSGNKRLLLLPYNDEFKRQRAAMRLLFTEDREFALANCIIYIS